MAYWNKQMRRRTLSSQVVFPTQAPKDTEEIWNPDPNMCDVMDVICQCMEVRSSTEEFSSCSFNNDCKRHSSINDLLSIMSWESALRTSNTTGRSSLGTALDSVLAAGHEGGDSRSLISNTIDNSGVGGGNNADADVTFPSRMSLLDQKPSFDPSRDPVEEGSTAIIKSMLEPAAVTAESVPMIMPAQQDFNHRPSFDPNHELTIATDIYSGRQAPVVDRGPPAAQVAPDAFAGGGNTGTASATPGMSRETSRGSRGVARIFKSAPTRPPVKGGTWKGGGVGEGHQWSDGGRDSSDSVGTATSGTVRWDASLTSTGATSTADTTTWGLPGTPTEGDADTSRMSMSPPRSRVTPPSAEEGRADVGAAPEVFTRPTQTRMPSLLWVKEPKPERRPTIRESQEMNLKLSNQANAAAWRRVTGDSDTTMVLTNIGSFLG